MKKILTILAAAAAVFAFTPAEAEAGGSCYRSKIHSRCGSCGGHVYSYYRPVSYCNSRPVYGWVPSYHSQCGRSHGHSQTGYGSSRGGYRSHGGTSLSFRYTTPGYRSAGTSYRSYPRGTTYRSYPSSRTSRGYGSCR